MPFGPPPGCTCKNFYEINGVGWHEDQCHYSDKFADEQLCLELDRDLEVESFHPKEEDEDVDE